MKGKINNKKDFYIVCFFTAIGFLVTGIILLYIISYIMIEVIIQLLMLII